MQGDENQDLVRVALARAAFTKNVAAAPAARRRLFASDVALRARMRRQRRAEAREEQLEEF